MLILMIDSWDIFCEISLRWMSLDLADDKSTLVQIMAWCCQAASHCRLIYMSSYGVTRPQWVNALAPWRYALKVENIIFKCKFCYQYHIQFWLNSTVMVACNPKSTLVLVMAWCRQATSHYRSQCWRSTMMLYDITMPQWVTMVRPFLLTWFNWD